MYSLQAEASFDAAHFLANHPGQCRNLHGHRWRLEVIIVSEALGAEGTERDMVCDFGRFKSIVRGLAEEFDHTFLVEEGTLKKKTIRALEAEGFQVELLPVGALGSVTARQVEEAIRERDW